MLNIDFLMAFLLIPLCAASFILALEKAKIIEAMQLQNFDFLAKLAKCELCLCVWSNFIFSVIFAIIAFDFWLLFIPFATIPITLKLIR